MRPQPPLPPDVEVQDDILYPQSAVPHPRTAPIGDHPDKYLQENVDNWRRVLAATPDLNVINASGRGPLLKLFPTCEMRDLPRIYRDSLRGQAEEGNP